MNRLTTSVLLLALAAPGAARGEEPADLRLLRTIHTGAPQEISLAEIRRLTDPAAGAPRHRWILARAALAVLGEDRGWPGYPMERLLAEQMGSLERWQGRDLLEKPAPPGFGEDDLVYTLLHVLAVTGKSATATELLERQLDSGNAYVRGVALQGLFNLGGPRDRRLLQDFTERQDEVWILASNLMRFSRFPTLTELARHWRDIPDSERDRSSLFQLLAEGCSSKAILAAYLVGFLPPARVPAQEAMENGLLGRAAWTFPAQGCFNGRYFAQRSLGLRSAADPGYWVERFLAEGVSWSRSLMARIGFARHGAEFARHAFDLLDEESDLAVSWELLVGRLTVGRGQVFRDYWDLWHTAPHYQFRLSFPGRFVHLPEREVTAALDWLEGRDEPPTERLLFFLLNDLADGARGRSTFRLLAYLWRHPDRYALYDALWSLVDPASLPFLRHALADPSAAEHHDAIEEAMARLERRESDLFTGTRPTVCCEKTEECLRSQFEDHVYRGRRLELDSEAAVGRWLERGSRAEGALTIVYPDAEGVVARVTDGATGDDYRFEYLLRCWRLVE